MKKILNIFAAFLLATGALFISGDTKLVSAQTAGSDLISQLPASDAVATINLKRLLNEAIPQFLASQPAALANLNAKIDEVKAKTGIDLRQFEQVAIGAKVKQLKGGVVETEPIVLVRGSFDAAGLIAIGKIAANGKFRQEQIGGKTVSIFTLPENAKDAAKKSDASGEMSEKIDETLSGEFATYVIDANTLAIGKLPHIRSSLLDKTINNHVAANLTELINRKPSAVMNFAGNIPVGMAASFGLGNDQIGKIVSSLRQMFGSLDMNDGAIALLLGARTSEEPQAQELENSLLGLQMLGKGMLGGKSDEKSQIAARVVENLKITRTASEVQMQTSLSNSDINKLLAKPVPSPASASNATPQ